MRAFLITILLAVAGSIANAQFVFPPLRNDVEKIQYGMWIREHLPGMFEETFEYGFDFWKLVDAQAEINRDLPPLIPPSMKYRKFLKIELKDRFAKKIADDGGFMAWKASLISFAESMNGKTKSDLLNEARHELSALQNVKPGDLMSSLLMTAVADPKQRGAAFKLSFNEKIALLNRDLPDDLRGSDFNFKKFGVKAESFGKKEALDLVASAFDYEARLPKILMILMSSENLPENSAVPALVEQIREMPLARFASFQSENAAQATLASVLESREAAAGARYVVKDAASSHQNGTQTVFEERPRLALIEVPPPVAILKSIVGSDCSHSCSFSKADSPFERVFFIVGADGKKKGYVESTMVDSDAGPVLYISSINGKAVTTQDTRETLQLLHASREKLGVKHIATLSADRVKGHINYWEIGKVFNEIAAGKQSVAIRPKNAAIQELIEKYVTVAYEKAAANPEAVIYEGGPFSPDFAVVVGSHEEKGPFSKPIDKKSVFLFALELDSVAQNYGKIPAETAGERVVKSAGFDIDEYHRLRDAFYNWNRLPVRAYYSEVARRLESYEITLDKKFENEHPYLFYEGFLLCPDSLSMNEAPEALRIFARMMKSYIWEPSPRIKRFMYDKAARQFIENSREFEAAFNWATDAKSLGVHTPQLRKMTGLGLGHDKIRNNPEIVRNLLRVVAQSAGRSWEGPAALGVLYNVFPDLDRVVLPKYAKDPDPVVRRGAVAALFAQTVWPKIPKPLDPASVLKAAADDADPAVRELVQRYREKNKISPGCFDLAGKVGL